MTMRVNENEEFLLKFDGRIMCMHTDHSNDVWAMFNERRPRSIKLTKEQFERYKSFCELPIVDEKVPQIKHYYGVIHDNGFPKWFNWL